MAMNVNLWYGTVIHCYCMDRPVEDSSELMPYSVIPRAKWAWRRQTAQDPAIPVNQLHPSTFATVPRTNSGTHAKTHPKT